MSESPAGPIISFRRKPMLLDPVSSMLFGSALGSALMAASLTARSRAPTSLTVVIWVLSATAAGVGLVVRHMMRRKGVAPLELHADHLALPRSAHGQTVDRVDYANVIAVVITTQTRRGTLMLETTHGTYEYPGETFCDTTAKAAIREGIRAHFRQLPGAGTLLLRMDEQEEAFRSRYWLHDTRRTLLLWLGFVALFWRPC